MENIKNLIYELKDFTKRTILGHEMEFYKKIPMMNNNNYDTLKTEFIKTFITGATEFYMNKLYKSLILEDDQYITDFLSK